MTATATSTPPAEASAPTQLTMAGALNAALRDAMAADDRVVVYGEDVGPLGGVFRVTDGLQQQFGEDRIWDSPLAESVAAHTRNLMTVEAEIDPLELFDHVYARPRAALLEQRARLEAELAEAAIQAAAEPTGAAR